MENPAPPMCAKIDMARSIPLPPRPALPVRAFNALREKGIAYAVRRAAEMTHVVDVPEAAPKPKHVWPSRDDEALQLQPGELVEVKSVDEIRETLDDEDRYKGLLFMSEMWKFAGQRFVVLKPMTNIISEATGALHTGIKNTVLLAESNCDGSAHGDCSAACYHMWREIWLRRVETDS